MGTDIRPEISKKNKYWISKHRYYELKHFCMQYKEFQKLYFSALQIIRGVELGSNNRENIEWSDPTGKAVELRELYLDRINLIEECARKADKDLSDYILKAVTENKTYAILRTNYYIPCSREQFYDKYRKFFYILSNARK